MKDSYLIQIIEKLEDYMPYADKRQPLYSYTKQIFLTSQYYSPVGSGTSRTIPTQLFN
jgi:hypothetical protein